MSRPQFILLIEPDDDSREMDSDYLHTFGFTVLTSDSTDDGLTGATDADVILTAFHVPCSRTPTCHEIYRRVTVL